MLCSPDFPFSKLYPGSRLPSTVHLTDNLHTAVFSIEIRPVILDLLAHSRRGCKSHLVRSDENQVCPKLLAVKLYIQKPVVIRAVICQRTVHQIIRSQIIHREQLLHRKRIVAGQGNHVCIFQNHFIQFIPKFFIFIVPEDNTTLIKLRQGAANLRFKSCITLSVSMLPLSSFRIFPFARSSPAVLTSITPLALFFLSVFLFQLFCQVYIAHTMHIRYTVPNQLIDLGVVEKIQCRIQRDTLLFSKAFDHTAIFF